MNETRCVYCCPQHALCDVAVPGSVGRRARAFFDACNDKSVWCGRASMGKGQAIIVEWEGS